MRILYKFYIVLQLLLVCADICIFDKDLHKPTTITCRVGYNYNFIDLEKLYIDYPLLETLVISGTSVNKIPRGLHKFTELKTLVIADNWKIILPKDLAQLSSLKILRLINLQLHTLPDGLYSLVNLEELDIQCNSIASLSEKFCNLASLENLNLKSNLISSLPDNFGSLKNLRVLDIGSNFICDLPNSFATLTSLKFLYSNTNRFSSLPDFLVELENLMYIHYDYNQIVELPECFGNFKNLGCLSLRNNRLETLPDKFFKLKNLKTLCLDGNRIKQLPRGIANLSCLNTLKISYNPLEGIPKEIQNIKKNLVSLCLFATNIKELSDDNTYGKQDLIKLFGEKIFKSELRPYDECFSVRCVYNKISKKKVHWNIKKLRKLILKPVPTYSLGKSEIFYIWDKVLAFRVLNSKNKARFRDFLEVIYSDSKNIAESNYYENISLYKSYIEALLTKLTIAKHSYKVKRCVDIICDGLNKRMGDELEAIKLCYYIILGNDQSDNDTIYDFISNYIAFQKEKVFSQIIKDVRSEPAGFIYNYWMGMIFDEIGLELSSFPDLNKSDENASVTKISDVYEVFYDKFTFESVLYPLTAEVNLDRARVRMIANCINQSKLSKMKKKELLMCSENHRKPLAITAKGMEYYLSRENFIDYAPKVKQCF